MESCHAVGSHRPYPDVFCSANLAFGGFCRLALSSRYSHRDNHERKGIVDPPPDVRRGWVPLLAAMFLNINALVIAIMIAAFFLHEATALWDASYATTARILTPIDQHAVRLPASRPGTPTCLRDPLAASEAAATADSNAAPLLA